MRKNHLSRFLPTALLSSALLLTMPQMTASAAVKTIGDVTGDGAVSVADGVALSRYVAKWEGSVIDKDTADLNRDGKIDKTDSAILVRYLANWEGYDKYITAIDAETLSTLRITKQPEGAAIEIGKNKLLSVEVKGGTAPYTYQWKCNGSPIKDAVKSEITVTDEGLYTCAVTDQDGNSVFSDLAAVKYELTITWQPIFNPEKNEISIVAAGGTEPYSYQWQIQYPVEEGEEWNDVENGTSETVAIDKNGVYRCVIKDEAGCTKTSNEISIDSILTITKQPQDNAKILEIEVEGGKEPYTYQWERKVSEDNWTPVEGGTESTLQTPDNGIYHCVVKDSDGSKVTSDPAKIDFFRKYTVFLEDNADNIVPLAKVLQDTLGIQYGPAKALVTQAPVVIATNMFLEEASALESQLDKAGGKARYYYDIPDPDCTVRLEGCNADDKIAVIKVIREMLGITLVEAKKLVDAAPCNVMTTGDRELAVNLASALEQSGAYVSMKNVNEMPCTVTLESCGTAKKMDLIRAVQNQLGTSLTEAKAIVENVPSLLLITENKEYAENLLAAVQEQGAVASMTIEEPEAPQRLYMFIDSYDENKKVATCKAIDSINGMGQLKARDLLEGELPAMLLDGATDSQALSAKDTLEALGAVVSFKDTRPLQEKDPALSSGSLKIILQSVRPEKINQLIPVLRKELCITLPEAIALAEHTPVTIAENATIKKVQALAEILCEAGATLNYDYEERPEAKETALYLHSCPSGSVSDVLALLTEALHIRDAEGIKLINNVPTLLSDAFTKQEAADLRSKLEALGAVVTYAEVPELGKNITFELYITSVNDKDAVTALIQSFFHIEKDEAEALIASSKPILASPRPYAEAIALQENLNGIAEYTSYLIYTPPVMLCLESVDPAYKDDVQIFLSKRLEINVSDVETLFEDMPCLLPAEFTQEEAETLKKALEKRGCVVSIKTKSSEEG